MCKVQNALHVAIHNSLKQKKDAQTKFVSFRMSKNWIWVACSKVVGNCKLAGNAVLTFAIVPQKNQLHTELIKSYKHSSELFLSQTVTTTL